MDYFYILDNLLGACLNFHGTCWPAKDIQSFTNYTHLPTKIPLCMALALCHFLWYKSSRYAYRFLLLTSPHQLSPNQVRVRSTASKGITKIGCIGCTISSSSNNWTISVLSVMMSLSRWRHPKADSTGLWLALPIFSKQL